MSIFKQGCQKTGPFLYQLSIINYILFLGGGGVWGGIPVDNSSGKEFEPVRTPWTSQVKIVLDP